MTEERGPMEEFPQHDPEGATTAKRRTRQREERIQALEARVSELESALEQKAKELETAQQKVQEYLDGWQRERATFENYRRRVLREMEEAGQVAKVDLIRSILPAVDNLERALSDTSTDAEVVRQGVRMTYSQILGTLQGMGLKEVPAAGERFDPNVHEAVDAVEGTGHDPDTIVESVQKGYTFGERLVRPARVRVAR